MPMSVNAKVQWLYLSFSSEPFQMKMYIIIWPVLVITIPIFVCLILIETEICFGNLVPQDSLFTNTCTVDVDYYYWYLLKF